MSPADATGGLGHSLDRVDDVVIVGAGPAGLAAAATLKARGIDATILESFR